MSVALALDSFERLVCRYTHESFFYAVADEEQGVVKLGRSKAPDQRVATLQTAHPNPLKLLTVVPEYVVPERDAHDRWKSIRLRGEWFSLTHELRGWLSEIEELRVPAVSDVFEVDPREVTNGRPIGLLVARDEALEEAVA